jgi:hypothetical protein
MPEINRRALLRLGLLGLGLVGGTVGSHRLAAGEQVGLRTVLIDEVYRGRRIIAYLPTVGTVPPVYIDGVELHVMTLRNGTYTSVMNHYQTFDTLLQTARAAVDNLRGAALLAHT